LTGIAGCFAGAATLAFLSGGDFTVGTAFFAGAAFSAGAAFFAGFEDSTTFAGAPFFAPGGFDFFETGIFCAGAGLDGLTAGFAFPLGEAEFGVVFFTAMAQG
jgi:hypothetical protein